MANTPASIALNTESMITGVSVQTNQFASAKLEFVYALLSEGSTSKTLDVTLRRNALVRAFDVTVTAASAARVAAGVAGQIRTTSRGGGFTSIVVDFGTLRTVAGIDLPSGLAVRTVSAWIGTKFADPLAFDPPKGFADLPSEIRTERIDVVVSGPVNSSKLATEMFFVMPDLPFGLEMRIDDGPPVFTHAAPVQPGPAPALTDSVWNKDASRIVHLGDAFAALVGDPARDEESTFKLTLTSKAPGLLDLVEYRRIVRYIRRASFDGANEKDVPFENEGQVTLRLDSLPQNLKVHEVRWNATATVPPMRVLPAVGPAPSGVAEIRVIPERAITVRLDSATPLGELTGMRFPLRAGASGAEARVMLWTNKQGANQPLETVKAGVSDPLTLESTENAQWATFTWAQPVKVPPEGLWAALVVNRGEVFHEFAAAGGNTSWATVLWGAPSGPWRDLPAALVAQRGRVRLIGTPKSGVKIDPYRISIGSGPDAGFTPNPKGVAGALTLEQPAIQTGPAELVITSHVPAALKLRDVEVVSAN